MCGSSTSRTPPHPRLPPDYSIAIAFRLTLLPPPPLLQVSSFLFERTSPLRLLLPEHILSMLGDWSGLLVASASPLPGPLIEALLRAGVKAVVVPQVAGVAAAAGAEAAAGGDAGMACSRESVGEAEDGLGQQLFGLLPRLLVKRTTTAAHGTMSCQSPVSGPEGCGGGSAGSLPEATAAPLADPEAAVLAFFAAFYGALFAGEVVLDAIRAGEAAAGPAIVGRFVCFHL